MLQGFRKGTQLLEADNGFRFLGVGVGEGCNQPGNPERGLRLLRDGLDRLRRAKPVVILYAANNVANATRDALYKRRL